ncbi:MAG: hypothetical protein HY820_21090 [Acidobacteria bacterium]|nr:hypothetical protein [Acidobacteriota bacterium]
MRPIVPVLALLGISVACVVLFRAQPTAAVQAASPNERGFRILFGERSTESRDFSGRVGVAGGKVVSLRGWRFLGGDEITGADSWKLVVRRGGFEPQPDRPNPLTAQSPPSNVLPAGVDVVVDAPPASNVTLRVGNVHASFTVASLHKNARLIYAGGDIVVQAAPVVEKLSAGDSKEEHDYPAIAVMRDGTRWVAWQAYQDNGDNIYARHTTPNGWSQTFRLTDTKSDIYRTAVAEDVQKRVWVVWAERDRGQSDTWHLYGRAYANGAWGTRERLTDGTSPNFSHRLVAARDGVLHLVWVGHEGGESYVYHRRLAGSQWSTVTRISGASAWVPDVATDSRGNAWIAWDSYRNGHYDVYLRSIAPNGSTGPEMQATKSPLFQSHASVAVDKEDRVWLAWDESGANWGKDWSHEDPWRGTVLYANRRVRVAVLDKGQWKMPADDVMAAAPARYPRYVEMPRLAADANGRIWLSAEIRTLAGNVRADYWAPGGRWERFLTVLDGDRWWPLQPVPLSSSRPEAPWAMTAAGQGIAMAFTDDNRGAGGPRQAAHHEIHASLLEERTSPPAPVLIEYAEPRAQAAPMHAAETADLKRIRDYRMNHGGASLRILRGDFHRHTEISQDGSGDGSIEDFFRYMIDAAGMETGLIADHNAGNDNEYSWWRTEKATLLYHVPGRYTPMFGYERSVPYPNGHRNLVFAARGIRTLPIAQAESRGEVNSGSVLYPYLKKNNGIGMLHSLATGQGSDYRDNDPQVEPLVELYQGYHASYEYEGAPRAESKDFTVNIHGGYRPLGFWWNALNKGLKLGVQASSDHIGTHNSYTLIYSPDMQRSSVLESMRARHAYAATDNIVVDFRAADASGKSYMMGDALRTKSAPRLDVVIKGTGKIDEIAIIKDSKFVFRTEPEGSEARFSFTDAAIAPKESYYYVRVLQRDRNIAWSSPIWVDYR